MQEDVTSVIRVGFTVIITAFLIGTLMLITAVMSDMLLDTNAVIDNAVVNNTAQSRTRIILIFFISFFLPWLLFTFILYHILLNNT